MASLTKFSQRFAAAFAAFALTLTVAAQEQAAPAPSAGFQQFGDLWGEGAYLRALASIENGREGNEMLSSTYRQARPALDGFVVLNDDLQQPLSAVDPAELARYDNAQAMDAVAEIVKRARNTRIVIVNEAHDNPRDRAFVLAVAEALRPLGYTHYAAETLSNFGTDEQKAERLSALVSKGYPLRGTGWYSLEPMFGYLLRRVVQLGYQPVSYEADERATDAPPLPPQEQIARREQGQAENLARAISAAGPEAKFLIHVGYSHVTERPITGSVDGKTRFSIEWMAARLAGLAGIDPLTIDQTDLGEYSARPGGRALYAALAGRVGDRPKVFLVGKEGVGFGVHGNATDLQVVHPPIRALNGRPDWLAHTGREALSIPATLLPKTGRRLIQIFAQTDGEDAIVPIDQVLVNAGGQASPVVYAPKGVTVRWAVMDETG